MTEPTAAGAQVRARGRPEFRTLALRLTPVLLAVLVLVDVLVTRPAGTATLGTLSVLLLASTSFGIAHEARSAASARAVTATLEALAAGDATARVEGLPTQDHRGLAAATDDLGRLLHRTVLEFRRATADLDTGWQDVRAVSVAMSDDAETTAARAADAAAAAEQVSHAVQMVAAAAHELVASFQDVSAHAAGVARVASAAASRVAETTATAVELAAATSRVEDVLGVITNVAHQTHLLALNARIEAASAGSFGAGFTVIAQEVRHLAGVTAEAAVEVGGTVRSIQVGTAQVTGGMQQMDETIASVSASQTAIAAAVEQQSQTTRSIGYSVTEAADRAAVIAETIAQFAKAAGLTAYSGTRARAIAGNIASTSGALRSVVDQFVLSDEHEQSAAIARSAAVALKRSARVDGRITVIANDVHGDGMHEFDFSGLWSHDSGSAVTDANSYSSVVDDSIGLRFEGSSVRLFGIKDAHHGILGVTLDGGSEIMADTYSAEREVGGLLFEGTGLQPGEHRLRVRITGQRNAAARFHWGAVTHAEVH